MKSQCRSLGDDFLFFIVPFLLANVIIVIALIISLILKQIFKPSIAKIPLYIAVVIGISIVYYGYRFVRGFDGAMICFWGIFTIIETSFFLIYLKGIFHKNFFTNKKLISHIERLIYLFYARGNQGITIYISIKKLLFFWL